MANVSFKELDAIFTPKKDFFDVTAGFVQEKPFDTAKAVYVAIDCLKEADLVPEGQEKTFNDVRHHANLVKLAKAPGALFTNTNELRHKASALMEEGPSLKGLLPVLRSANSCISPIWDMTDFLTKAILYIPKKSVETFKGFNALSLILSMGWNAFDSCNALVDAERELQVTVSKEQHPIKKKLGHHLIRLVKQISYIALGILTVLAVFFQAQIASFVFTIFSASTVVCTILEYYHSHLNTVRKF